MKLDFVFCLSAKSRLAPYVEHRLSRHSHIFSQLANWEFPSISSWAVSYVTGLRCMRGSEAIGQVMSKHKRESSLLFLRKVALSIRLTSTVISSDWHAKSKGSWPLR